MESSLCPADAINGDADFRLIETFGYVPGQGVTRQILHLARMAASASAFAITFDSCEAERQLAALLGHPDPLRCRLTLDANGGIDLQTAPMPPIAAKWRFAIAPVRLKSEDVFLHHKTTRRGLYDQARQELPLGLDEVVFLNERDEVCEGTISNIMITATNGERLTPALTSGCLPGVYRQSCLDRGLLSEAVLTLRDLAEARSIHLVNSLRGPTQAIWASECREFASFA